MSNQHPELFRRHPLNPILTVAAWPYPANSVFNPGATLLPDGTTLLLVPGGGSARSFPLCVRPARPMASMTGRLTVSPLCCPTPKHVPEELWGIEDPRITYVAELNKYAIVYTAYSRVGPGVALALTEDFRHFERYGMIMSPEDKDAALLPYRIGG